MLFSACAEEMRAGEEMSNSVLLAIREDWKCTVLPNPDSPALGRFAAFPRRICAAHSAVIPSCGSALVILSSMH